MLYVDKWLWCLAQQSRACYARICGSSAILIHNVARNTWGDRQVLQCVRGDKCAPGPYVHVHRHERGQSSCLHAVVSMSLSKGIEELVGKQNPFALEHHFCIINGGFKKTRLKLHRVSSSLKFNSVTSVSPTVQVFLLLFDCTDKKALECVRVK